MAYLKIFSIPDDYQEKILEAHRKLDQAYGINKQRTALQTRDLPPIVVPLIK